MSEELLQKLITDVEQIKRVLGLTDDSTPVPPPKKTSTNWMKMSLADLKSQCKKQGIKIPSTGSGKSGNFLKSDYVNLLSSYEQEEVPRTTFSTTKNKVVKKKELPVPNSKKPPVVFDERIYAYTDGEFIYDGEKSQNILAQLKDNEIKPLSKSRALKLSNDPNLKLYHVEVKNLSPDSPLSLQQVNDILSAIHDDSSDDESFYKNSKTESDDDGGESDGKDVVQQTLKTTKNILQSSDSPDISKEDYTNYIDVRDTGILDMEDTETVSKALKWSVEKLETLQTNFRKYEKMYK